MPGVTGSPTNCPVKQLRLHTDILTQHAFILLFPPLPTDTRTNWARAGSQRHSTFGHKRNLEKMAPRPSLLSLAVLVGTAAVVLGYMTLQRPLGPAIDSDEVYCYDGIRTHHDEGPSANCFSVRAGLFSSVSSGEATEGVKRDGYVIPGLWDGHGHLLPYGEFLHSVDLFGTRSFEEVRERLTGYLERNPGAGTKDAWVRGVGWDQMALGKMPTAVCPVRNLTLRRAR